MYKHGICHQSSEEQLYTWLYQRTWIFPFCKFQIWTSTYAYATKRDNHSTIQIMWFHCDSDGNINYSHCIPIKECFCYMYIHIIPIVVCRTNQGKGWNILDRKTQMENQFQPIWYIFLTHAYWQFLSCNISYQSCNYYYSPGFISRG